MSGSDAEQQVARMVAVLAATSSEPPPGVEAGLWSRAMLEDVYELIAELDLVTPVIATPGPEAEVADLAWPGTKLIGGVRGLAQTLSALTDAGAGQAVIVAADVPDLPPLIIGKLFRPLGRVAVTYSPAPDGELVALGCALPVPPWFPAVELDTPGAAATLRAAAPRPGLVRAGPPWHRLRSLADIARLDAGLEGWEATRALLSA